MLGAATSRLCGSGFDNLTKHIRIRALTQGARARAPSLRTAFRLRTALSKSWRAGEARSCGQEAHAPTTASKLDACVVRRVVHHRFSHHVPQRLLRARAAPPPPLLLPGAHAAIVAARSPPGSAASAHAAAKQPSLQRASPAAQWRSRREGSQQSTPLRAARK